MANASQPKSSPLRVLNTCLWLVDQLQTHGRMTYNELNDNWLNHNATMNKAGNYDLEKRTLQHYWQYIDTMFNIVVHCDRRTNEYFIDEHYDTKITDWLLSTFSVSNILGESREIQNRILLEEIPSGQKFLTPIISAMKENHPIELSYQKFSDDEPNSLSGDPLCLKLVQQRWYVLLRVPSKGYYTMYALDRIKDLSIKDDIIFTLPKGFDAQSSFQYSYGAFTTKLEKSSYIKILVNDMQRKYWRTLPIHHTQHEDEIYADHSIFCFHLQITPDFVNLLLSLGDRIEVLFPNDLRETIKEQHMRAAAIYE